MTYFVSEDTKISGKWIQLISRSVDINDQSASQPVSLPVSQSVCTWQTNWLQPAGQSVCACQTDWLKIYIYNYIFPKWLISLQKIKNIWKMDSTCITKYGYNGPVSQPVSQSVSLFLADRLTSASQSVCPSILDRQTDFYKWLISFQQMQKYQENGFNLYHGVWI